MSLSCHNLFIIKIILFFVNKVQQALLDISFCKLQPEFFILQVNNH